MRKLIKQLLCYFNYRFLLKNKNVVIEFGATYTKDSQFDKYVKLYKNSNINNKPTVIHLKMKTSVVQHLVLDKVDF